ncbi:UNVERIFIED_CONTAM: hypothetical protein Sradi_5033900 [Sesamum radiatum]|uniref:Uncharacterized protein n=1 Tax=Sesamum radiatum TaxID=300843 RepID=A0AAW2MGQ4_SESRA
MPENPLHTAALLGHLEFTKLLLGINPGLSKSVNPKGSSALHLASAKGHVNIVKELVSADSSMCFKLDGDGRSPLHLAAIKGRTVVLEELLRAEPEAAAVLTGGGESCLHLCVKYNRLEAMKVFLQCLQRDDRFVDWKDQEGNTALHLAVAKKQIEIVRYLLENTRIETDARNANGLTALDLLLQSPGDLRDLEIKQCLDQGSASRTERNKSMALKADISKTFRSFTIQTDYAPKQYPQETQAHRLVGQEAKCFDDCCLTACNRCISSGALPTRGCGRMIFQATPIAPLDLINHTKPDNLSWHTLFLQNTAIYDLQHHCILSIIEHNLATS